MLHLLILIKNKQHLNKTVRKTALNFGSQDKFFTFTLWINQILQGMKKCLILQDNGKDMRISNLKKLKTFKIQISELIINWAKDLGHMQELNAKVFRNQNKQ